MVALLSRLFIIRIGQVPCERRSLIGGRVQSLRMLRPAEFIPLRGGDRFRRRSGDPTMESVLVVYTRPSCRRRRRRVDLVPYIETAREPCQIFFRNDV